METGDYCRIIPQSGLGHVEHYRCDDYPDGAVTNCITGRIVTIAPVGAPKGFKRDETISPRFTPTDSRGDVWDTNGRTL